MTLNNREKPHEYPPLLILPIVLAVSQAWADTDPTPEETVTLSPVTVTGTQQQKANRVTFNPKAALQPLPAGDGADLLQSVPNMSIIRKGGSSGDPLFRGLGGSRLSVNADDQFYLWRLRYAHGSADCLYPPKLI